MSYFFGFLKLFLDVFNNCIKALCNAAPDICSQSSTSHIPCLRITEVRVDKLLNYVGEEMKLIEKKISKMN